ncbi:hypothetical protein P691DRAFT_812534 [Macrolepiota fuliginosa MF-IS2]|uniref:Uncharacterized protein n=1 Tax=Macrolepiota fuliginosa MF-IS2 TaxID=1400762 RepID=A0A9P5XDM9_9AGAR|nr:hypothetical protein P691DRAFT_812534 [Macrolepiota fuliginosa MF-IS2]
MSSPETARNSDSAPLHNGNTSEKPSARGGALGAYGPMSPAEGYGPRTDDPVSYQRYFTRIANPGPTGMWAFAVTVFLWSFYVVGTRSVNSDTAIVGMGLFVGGLAQFMAGMWEFPRGNVYGSAFFTLYGSFWISYAVSLVVLGVNSFTTEGPETKDALGIYLMVWFIITFFFFLGVVRRSIAFSLLTFFWGLSYILLSTSFWSNHHRQSLRDAGGAFGFVTALIALYIGLSQIHNAEYSLVRMPLGHLGGDRSV